MIFHSITICNLFSYYGPVVFRFNAPGEDKNIILISGRNGYGKTNFINSVKLLFSGINDELSSSMPGAARKLSHKQYLLGMPNLWKGALNQKAMKENAGPFYIEIQWEENAGAVRARREWILDGAGSVRQKIRISSGFIESDKEDEEAQNFLDERLPQDYIPFFFFDGEQIQKMIDISQTNLQKHMERLLNISQIDTATDFIAKAQSGWKKEAMVEREKADLQKTKHTLKERESEIAVHEETCGHLEEELLEAKEENERISRRLDRFMESSQAGDEKVLKKEKEEIENRIDELTLWIADEISEDSPLLFNPRLLSQAMAYVKAILESDAGTQSDLINSFIRTLPTNLFDTPPFPDPGLSDYQMDFYKNRLVQLLQAYKPVPDRSKFIFSIEKARALKLSGAITPFMNAAGRRQALLANFRKINGHKRRLEDLIRRLEDLPSLTFREKEEFEKTKRILAEKSEEIGRKEEQIQEIRLRIGSCEREMGRLKKEIRHLEDRVEVTDKAKIKVELAKDLRAFFKNYKIELKKMRRKEIESKLDQFSQTLISSTREIKKIRVDEDFVLHPYGEGDKPIGIHSLSSGIRQLIATALLWALKVVSGKTVPLIIDTPLGRIDKTHQENLLKYYYPDVGDQVIILPTDSELDERKYDLLRPHICQEFKLQNPDGDSTQYVEAPMY